MGWSIRRYFWVLCMLLFALCIQDEHATQVKFTVINRSHNMPAEYILAVFKLHDLIHVFLQKMYLLLLKINTLVAIFKCLQKIFYKEKMLVF